MKKSKSISVGRETGCDIVLDNVSVSRRHASVELTDKGFLAVQDLNSSNGTFLKRNGQWIKIRNVLLGRQDSVRFGEEEVTLDRLASAFGDSIVVRLRKNSAGRLSDRVVAEMAAERQILEHPRRNPVTGNIEEDR
jgi:pSer/pThr/pTyr-binding forkhead associated (FHA) protein